MGESKSHREPTGRRSTVRVIADFLGYGSRVMLRKQDAVHFKDLPRDMQWQQASLLPFVALTVVGYFADSAWLDQMRVVLFVIFFGLTCVSIYRGRRDVLRFTPDWVGSVGS